MFKKTWVPRWSPVPRFDAPEARPRLPTAFTQTGVAEAGELGCERKLWPLAKEVGNGWDMLGYINSLHNWMRGQFTEN